MKSLKSCFDRFEVDSQQKGTGTADGASPLMLRLVSILSCAGNANGLWANDVSTLKEDVFVHVKKPKIQSFCSEWRFACWFPQ